MIDYPYIKQQCRVCVYCTPIRDNKYICGFDSKIYEVHPNFINENMEITCSCRNKGFKYDKNKHTNNRF